MSLLGLSQNLLLISNIIMWSRKVTGIILTTRNFIKHAFWKSIFNNSFNKLPLSYRIEYWYIKYNIQIAYIYRRKKHIEYKTYKNRTHTILLTKMQYPALDKHSIKNKKISALSKDDRPLILTILVNGAISDRADKPIRLELL